MKLLIVLFAVVAAVSAYPGYDDPWQSYGWKQPLIVKSGWHHGWQPQPLIAKSGWSSGWQKPAYGWPHSYGWPSYAHGWQPQHHVHHVDAIHVAQQPAIPALHPHPLKLHGNDHVTRIHYDHPHIPHPHLIGHEVAVHEPVVKHVAVHHGGHGHGW